MKKLTQNRDLGYFLEYGYWQSAIRLLKYQLEIKQTNRHFNKLSMFYYERIGRAAVKVAQPNCFRQRVASNLFYGLGREFAILPYLVPKANLGLRRYKFLTYPMRILYYAVGLYFVALAQDFLREHRQLHKNVKSWYGGNLAFDVKTKELLLQYAHIWYKPHYKNFRREVRREVRERTDDKIILQLDIQNYYDEIDFATLLDLLTEYIKPSVQQSLRFDAVTKNELLTFFAFLALGRRGIPQADNDIVSSYIGNLYMTFGDIFLAEEIRRIYAQIEDHKIIRYLDDIYISITFPPKTSMGQKEELIHVLASQIADCLYDRLGLRLNFKTRVFWLYDPKERGDLEKSLKRVSPSYDISDEDSDEHPSNKIANIFRQLDKLKKTRIDSAFGRRTELDDEVLKEVYDDRVQQLLDKPENKRRLRNIFDGFNFDLVNADPMPLIILILYDTAAASHFEYFLMQKPSLSSRDAHLILTYLCQTNFTSPALIRTLKKNQHLSPIIDIFKSGSIASRAPGYYRLSSGKCRKIAKMPHVIEQIRERILREHKGEYTVALSHLLNEIHAICFELDNNATVIEKYKATGVVDFLASKGLPTPICLAVRNLFDRRNKSPVSHPDPSAWTVTQEEYTRYHSVVGECLDFIL